MRTNMKPCERCGEEFAYSWEGVGEIDTDICLDCMAQEMSHVDRGENQQIAGRWMAALKR